MGVLAREPLPRLAFLVFLFLACGTHLRAQDLPPALAERFSQAVAALKAGDLDAAEKALREVVAGGGDRSFVHHNLGIVLEQRGQHEAAVAEFRTAARLDPTFGPARLLAGTSLLELGRTREALTELQRAVRLMPTEAAAHLQLADACERLGDIGCLVRALKAASDIAPRDPDALYRLGKAYLRLSQWSYERIQKIDPASPRLSEALGREMREQGRLDEAVQAYQQAIERGPTLPGLHLALARIHADRGRWDQALAEVDRELTLVPESASARELKAAIERARGAPK
jgi:tetratricopeptide (TPR) repeat protein